ncbi:pentatricopeptide repeat-containing protein At4g39530-like [Durio zibethinus]|uniref:Pentatricopeptide repeat-containing protein At4g39530-like n=1 Tax=Durio zibethinus TaxID=66656 RepID=A0A6P5Y8A9_DURZI|nr:pentatricopeptide repeat-containing protein At4g39530-like [Durio zibethinus]
MPAFQLLPLGQTDSASLQLPKQRTKIRNVQLQRSVSSQNLSYDRLALDSVSTVHTLKSRTGSRNLELGSCIHATVLKSGLQSNVFFNNSLLDMYMKCGCIEEAIKLFDHMPKRTVASWTSMISGYCHNGLADEGISTFVQMLENECPNEFTLAAALQAVAQIRNFRFICVVHSYILKSGYLKDSFLQNSLVGAYAKSGAFVDAVKLLDRLSSRDVVSWTSVISGFVLHGLMGEALQVFFRMQEDGIIPNEVTILSVLHACSFIGRQRILQWIHGFVSKLGWRRHELVLNSVAEMYLTNGYLREGIQLFSEFCFDGEGQFLCPETMATLLQGCGHSNYLKFGKQLHGYLIKHGFSSCVVENSLINMYAENKQSDSAFQVFARMNVRDIISWNSLITHLVKNGQFHEALMLLKDIHSNRGGEMVRPDFITMLASIQACSNLSSFMPGQVIHGYITKTGLISDIFIQNALIDMYGRSGRLDLAEKTFEEMSTKDIGSWNSLIAAYGINGNGRPALLAFTGLNKSSPHKPNAITFTNILSACSHAGLVEEGYKIFNRMREYEVEPSMEHFVCVVDLLGRSGKLEEAEAFIKDMPVTPANDVWYALLGACGFFGNISIAERVAKKLSVQDPEGKAWRVALSNVYASRGQWEDAAKMRSQVMQVEGMRKEVGWSTVEVEGEMFRFMVNDTRHPESKLIYATVNGMMKHVREGVTIRL